MAKAYWVATYRSISDAAALAGYAKLAGPAITAAGGRFLARGTAAKAYEAGLIQRVVIIEFDSVENARRARQRRVPGRTQGPRQGRRSRSADRRGCGITRLHHCSTGDPTCRV
ncbi:MAG: DUF1330 domain-containing protein [Stellaceae bacterium]